MREGCWSEAEGREGLREGEMVGTSEMGNWLECTNEDGDNGEAEERERDDARG